MEKNGYEPAMAASNSTDLLLWIPINFCTRRLRMRFVFDFIRENKGIEKINAERREEKGRFDLCCSKV